MAALENKKVYSLPRNRKELFAEVFRNHWFEIIKLSLVITLFAIPFVTVYMLKAVNVGNMFSKIDENMAVEEMLDQLIQLMRVDLVWMVGIFFGIIILFIGIVMGMSYLKTLIFEPESAKIKDHFFGSFKKSIRDGLVIGLFNAVVVYVLKVSTYLLVIYRIDTTGIWGIVMASIVYIILFGLSMYMIALSAFYKMTIFGLFKNSFLLYFVRFLPNLGMELLLYGPFMAAMVLGYIFASEIVLVLYMGFLFGLTSVVVSIYTQIEFDEYINREQYPELLNNHIYPSGKSQSEE